MQPNKSNPNPNITEGLQKATAAAKEAIKLGKTAAEIAKGTAAGGIGGIVAALKNPKSTAKLVVILVIIVLLPILLIALLPLIIFGAIIGFIGGVLSRIGAFFQSLPVIGAIISGIMSLFGGGSSAVVEETEYIHFDNAFDMAHIVYNLEQAHEIIGDFHLERFEAVMEDIEDEISEIPNENEDEITNEARIVGLTADSFQFNTSVILGMYAASLYEDVMQISLQDLRDAMRRADDDHELFSFIVEEYLDIRTVYPDPPLPFQYVFNPETEEYETPGWVFSDNINAYVPEHWVYNPDGSNNNSGGSGSSNNNNNGGNSSGSSNNNSSGVENGSISGTGTGAYEPPPPQEIELNIHSFIIVYVGEMVFAEIFGIADDPRLMTFAHEYARNLLSLLTDTEMGAWFGVILEAGEVDGFYSPFPNQSWTISSPFGWRNNPFDTTNNTGNQEWHNGIDIPKPIGTPIRAIADGYVILSQFSASAGNWIRIDHGYIEGFGYIISEYMHNSRNFVSVTNPPQRIEAGQVIAEVGSTGRSTAAHLHLGILVNNSHVNPISFINAPP